MLNTKSAPQSQYSEMAPSTEIDALAILETTISNLKTLLHRFQTALQSPTLAHSPIEDTPNPLAVLSDASQILKAQTTKLSLLLLNKPFTPSAITFILTSLSNSCLPALMSALELCPADKYTTLMHQYIKSSLSRIMMELLSLLSSIPKNEHGVEKTLDRDTLASTGVLWAECDKMVALGSGGVTKVAAERVEEYHGLLKDAIAELEEWDPDEDSESDTDSLPSSKGNTSSSRPIDTSLEQSVQDLSLSSIAALRKQTLGTLRIIRVLYPAFVKRRILTFPNINSTAMAENLPSSVQIRSLDELIDRTQQFTEETDEIAGALYAGDEEEVDGRLTKLAEASKTCVEGVRLSWSGNKDEFTTWAEKWMMRLDEVRRG